MAIAYIDENIPIPRATITDIRYEFIGESSRTALGKQRQDSINIKEVWTIEAQYLTWDEYFAIKEHVLEIQNGLTKFWSDEFGGTQLSNSINAFVRIESDERTPFIDDRGKHDKGHSITLEVKEE
ncbi:MAG: hypothetical protein ACQEQF_00365 [Bacillota bacterium]